MVPISLQKHLQNILKIEKRGKMFVFKHYPQIVAFFGNKNNSLRDIIINGFSKDITTNKMVLMEQTHSNKIKTVEQDDLGTKPVKIVDAIATNKKDQYLLIKTADCAPILVFDPQKMVVCAIHSGKIGTQKGILPISIKFLVKNYGCKIKDLLVAIGPCISGKNYKALNEEFEDFVRDTQVEQTFPFLDIKKVLLKNLSDLGFLKKQITVFPTCTFDDDSYYSFRKDKTQKRQISLIGIKKNANIPE